MTANHIEERLKLLRNTREGLLAQFHATSGAIQELELLCKAMATVVEDEQEEVDPGSGVQDGPDALSEEAE